MPLLLALARAFVNFFGITKPTPEHESRAAWFIGGLLLLILAMTFAVFLAFMHLRNGA